MIVSTYQAASGAGAPGMAELEAQLAALGRGEEIPEPRAFAAQLASNLIPQIGGVKEEGFTSEEMKLQNEGRKIMHLPELRVNCTCVRRDISNPEAARGITFWCCGDQIRKGAATNAVQIAKLLCE